MGTVSRGLLRVLLRPATTTRRIELPDRGEQPVAFQDELVVLLEFRVDLFDPGLEGLGEVVEDGGAIGCAHMGDVTRLCGICI